MLDMVRHSVFQEFETRERVSWVDQAPIGGGAGETLLCVLLGEDNGAASNVRHSRGVLPPASDQCLIVSGSDQEKEWRDEVVHWCLKQLTLGFL